MIPASQLHRTSIMPLRFLYAVVILCFMAVHGIAIQKLSALALETHAMSIDKATGD
jgi:hypothetical protein